MTAWISPLPPRGTMMSTYSTRPASSADRRAIGGFQHLHRRGRQAGGFEAAGDARRDGQVRVQRLRAAAQDAGVAGFEAQPGRVGGDVGARFVDDADHAQRHAHAPDADAGRPGAQLVDRADRIGQRRDLAQAVGHAGDATRVQRRRSSSASSRPAARPAARSLSLAARKRRFVALQGIGNRQQGGVLGRRAGAGQVPRGHAGALAKLLHVSVEFHGQLRCGWAGDWRRFGGPAMRSASAVSACQGSTPPPTPLLARSTSAACASRPCQAAGGRRRGGALEQLAPPRRLAEAVAVDQPLQVLRQLPQGQDRRLAGVLAGAPARGSGAARSPASTASARSRVA